MTPADPSTSAAKPRLIVFAGHAGTGKTTLARIAVPRLHELTGESFCVLDKDTVYGAFSSKVMGLLTGDADDRDSPTYLENLRDQEYSGLLDIARENLALDLEADQQEEQGHEAVVDPVQNGHSAEVGCE